MQKDTENTERDNKLSTKKMKTAKKHIKNVLTENNEKEEENKEVKKRLFPKGNLFKQKKKTKEIFLRNDKSMNKRRFRKHQNRK